MVVLAEGADYDGPCYVAHCSSAGFRGFLAPTAAARAPRHEAFGPC